MSGIKCKYLEAKNRIFINCVWPLSQEALSPIIYEVQTLAVMAHPKSRLNVIKSDSADYRVLECALAGKAKWIVSAIRICWGLENSGQ